MVNAEAPGSHGRGYGNSGSFRSPPVATEAAPKIANPDPKHHPMYQAMHGGMTVPVPSLLHSHHRADDLVDEGEAR